MSIEIVQWTIPNIRGAPPPPKMLEAAAENGALKRECLPQATTPLSSVTAVACRGQRDIGVPPEFAALPACVLRHSRLP